MDNDDVDEPKPVKRRGRKKKPTEVEEKLMGILSGGQLSAEDQEKYKGIRADLEKQTQNRLSGFEYDNLTKIMVWLDRYDEFERSAGLADVKPALVQQARLYRETVLKHIEEVRKRQEGTGTFLQQAQKEVQKLEELHGAELQKIEKKFEKTVVDLVEEEKKKDASI